MSTRNIVFIDSRVLGYEALIAGLSADTQWYLLDAQQDGVEQMQKMLADHAELDSIQVVSHGAAGTLYLGSTVLNQANLADYRNQLETVGASLASTGDLLLYGCNVAQGVAGIDFVNALAQITGADVAASNDLTGSESFGGDWDLEFRTGEIAAGLDGGAFTGMLSTTGNDSLVGEDGNDTIEGLGHSITHILPPPAAA